MRIEIIVAAMLGLLMGCTLFRVEGPAFSGMTTIQPPAVCPSPVPGVIRPSGVVQPAS